MTSAKEAARSAKNSTAMHALARSGFAASGLLHIVIGLIAIAVATGTGDGKEADQSGALAQLREVPGGLFLLWAAVVGLAALGVWLVLSAVLDRAWAGKRSRAAHIAQNVAKAVVYFVLAGTAFVVAMGSPASSAHSTGTLGANLLATPGGVFVVVAIGLVLLGVAAYMVVKGVTKRFERDIRMPRPPASAAVRTLGVVGYVARGVALGAVGVLFIVGAATNDPGKTTGLDGALKSFVSLPFGVAVLTVVGIGWIAFGVYAFFRARLARL